MSAHKWVYLFEEGSGEMRDLLGGKGANLAEMTRLGIPVPPGFVVTTEACNAYLAAGERFPEGLWDQLLAALSTLEARVGKKFGDPQTPLLVSCRSGAKFSMPGMMDTVLNLGLNDAAVQGLARAGGGARFAYDSYRRLIQMFGAVVLGVPDEPFEEVLRAYRRDRGVTSDAELTSEDLQGVVERFKAIVREHTGRDFPQDPLEQLRLAIEAVFRSWNGKRAVAYRNATGIPHDLGTAVNVVTMVFGNMGPDCATGVAMSRNATTGEKRLEGDYLVNAQGEDVVAGIRLTKPLEQLKEEMPQVYEELSAVAAKLERHFRDMQDMEFTVEHGKLWMLQTRSGKRTARAAVRIAVDMAEEGLIAREEALRRVTPEQVEFFLHPQFPPEALSQAQELAQGLNVSPGAAVGQVVFDPDRAERWAQEGRPVILVRPETKPDDVHGMLAAQGILTSRGGRTSHAALVARQFGKPAVVGVAALEIDLGARRMRVGEHEVAEGDWISLDGTTGAVFLGRLETVVPDVSDPWLAKLLDWADRLRRLGVRANADYPRDARRARDYGAEGIGLCRTEHMFFEPERLPLVRKMILAEDPAERRAAIEALLPYQREDFIGLFRVMDGLPVIIRLLDPPLHEFLPPYEKLLAEVLQLRAQGDSPELAEKEALLATLERLREANPMLGLRGVRLGILMPELTRMQVRAIFEAACTVAAEGVRVLPEVMIPLVSHASELQVQRESLEAVAREVMAERGLELTYQFGTMIEIPRAALTAEEIAQHAEFFSFGTNDLTQTTFGISRDDAEKSFLVHYVERGILPVNPFDTLDEAGVGRLIALAVEGGRKARPDLEVGICGEHGGDPASIALCHRLGLDYVSCSPFRVPVARLAAAQAALDEDAAKSRRTTS